MLGKIMEVIGVAFIILLFMAIPAVLFMVCFNYVAPVFIATAPKLTFVQSLALLIAVKTLIVGNVTLGNKKAE